VRAPRGAPTPALREAVSQHTPPAADSARRQPTASCACPQGQSTRPFVRHGVQRPARGRRWVRPAGWRYLGG
jgi:hypothetical protein